MSPFVRLMSAALLASAIVGAATAAQPKSPFRLRCEIDYRNAEPTVQFYRIDPAAGEVVAEPGSRFTRAGEPDESEALSGVRIIESWTEDEIIFRWDVRSKTGPQTASFRDVLNLKTLTLRVESVMQLRGLTPHPSTYPGRCKRAPLEPATN